MFHTLSAKVLLAVIPALFLSACTPPTENNIEEDAERVNMTTNFPTLQALKSPAPSVARKESQAIHHGLTVNDPYHWLRDPNYPNTDDQEVLDYLNAENQYFKAFLEPHKPLVDRLFEEFKGRVDENESSVPFVKNGFEYRWEFKSGNNYRTRIRRNLATGEDQVFLDEQALSEGQDYFVIGSWDVSPDNQLLVYTIDTKGDERYTAVVKDITSNEILPIDLSNISGSVDFAPDGSGIVYSKLSDARWMVESVNLRFLEQTEKTISDVTLFTEDNDQYFLGAFFTSDDKWLVKVSSQNGNNEIAVVPANKLTESPVTLVSKADNIEASIDAAHGKLYVLANDSHVNFRLAVIDANEFGESLADKSLWQTLIEGSQQQYLMDLQTFNNFIALKLRNNGQDQIQLLDFNGAMKHQIEFPETVYRASLSVNPEFTQTTLRLTYESMITPDTVFDYQVAEQELILRKVDQLPSGYDKSNYVTERLMAPSRDGVMIPISIVYHKSFNKDGLAPLSLYAYGAYGSGMSPSFSSERLSILDRGFAFAIAHVRGGDEMGYQWYLDGKLQKRKNAFNDFIDVANYLIEEKYTSAGNISISGRSAGGQMMGAMTIQAPELWRSVLLGVPFVDVLNTMLDASLPLTPPEWQEWGNPLKSQRDFEYIMSYSPYDQITEREYPPMMVTGGLNDPRVTYWEPAKWTAKMRATKTDNNLLVMRMSMGAGHFTNSGRYARLKDRAEEYAFQLIAHGVTE